MKHLQRSSLWLNGARPALAALLVATGTQAETLLTDFDNNFYFDDMYASWSDQIGLIGGANDWTITDTNFGGAVVGFYELDGFTPKIVDASADQLVELRVTVAGTGAVAGPQLLLQDADGTRLRYSWYGLGPGSYTLVATLASGFVDGAATGTVPGLDLTNLVLFHIQVDPGFQPPGGYLPYTLTLENLRSFPTPPPPCHTLLSDFNNLRPNGGYASWATLAPAAPDNWTVTDNGFGGGYQDISPNANAAGETTLELRVSVTNTAISVGSTVVLQDADGTQNTWSWYGLTNGSYVLTQPLSAGNPVPAQPGSVPGLNTSNLDWFHVQVDPGDNTNDVYTVTFENVAIVGFDPTITAATFNPAASQFNLIWDSRPGRTYGLAYVSDLTGAFSVVATNIASGGTSTTNTVTVPAGQRGFVQAFEVCQ